MKIKDTFDQVWWGQYNKSKHLWLTRRIQSGWVCPDIVYHLHTSFKTSDKKQMNSQPMARYLKKSQPEIRGSLALRGGLFIMSRSGGLKPSAVAGKPSVTRFTHSSCTGIRASGKPSAAVRKILQRKKKTPLHTAHRNPEVQASYLRCPFYSTMYQGHRRRTQV